MNIILTKTIPFIVFLCISPLYSSEQPKGPTTGYCGVLSCTSKLPCPNPAHAYTHTVGVLKTTTRQIGNILDEKDYQLVSTSAWWCCFSDHSEDNSPIKRLVTHKRDLARVLFTDLAQRESFRAKNNHGSPYSCRKARNNGKGLLLMFPIRGGTAIAHLVPVGTTSTETKQN